MKMPSSITPESPPWQWSRHALSDSDITETRAIAQRVVATAERAGHFEVVTLHCLRHYISTMVAYRYVPAFLLDALFGQSNLPDVRVRGKERVAGEGTPRLPCTFSASRADQSGRYWLASALSGA